MRFDNFLFVCSCQEAEEIPPTKEEEEDEDEVERQNGRSVCDWFYPANDIISPTMQAKIQGCRGFGLSPKNFSRPCGRSFRVVLAHETTLLGVAF